MKWLDDMLEEWIKRQYPSEMWFDYYDSRGFIVANKNIYIFYYN